MKKSWLSDQTDEQKEETKKHFANADILRSKLIGILDGKEKEIYTSSLASGNYNKDNWALAQADMIGFMRALHYVKSLIKDEK